MGAARRPGGVAIVTVVFSAADVGERRSLRRPADQPHHQRRHRLVEGEPQAAGACATTAPSAGSALTSEACAQGLVHGAPQELTSKAQRAAATSAATD